MGEIESQADEPATIPSPLEAPERWRYECPNGHTQGTAERGGEALYCPPCNTQYELTEVLDKVTGEMVR